MRKIIFFILLAFVLVCEGQIVTTFNSNPGTSKDGTHKWDVTKFELYNNGVLMYFEITALKPIRRLNICNSGKVTFGEFELHLRGLYNSDEKVQYFSKLGWDKVGIGEKRVYTLYFGGDGYGGNIPSGVTQVSVKGIEVEADGKTSNWQWEEFTINNPRKNYTNITSEYSAKQKIDANNDGICGIYEQIGKESNYKLACIKEYGEYKLVYLSSSVGYDWWQVGDVKANLHQSASGIFKADWYMANKTINKDCYIVFDGTTMTVTHLSGIASKKAEETKYLKMYPTYTPSNNNSNYNSEQTPQRRQTTPQQNRVPQLKKQTVK